MKTHQGIEYDIVRYPPADIYDEAVKRFGIDFYNRGTVFAYAPYIHARSGKAESHLVHHELTHFKQQAAVGGPSKWWRIYFDNPKQRMAWELEAYQEQYKYVVENYRQKDHYPLLKEMAQFLVGMYDLEISFEMAKEMIKNPELSPTLP